MIVTNNEDFYQYLQNRGVVCLYTPKPSIKYPDGVLVVVFPETHNMTTCGNRFNKQKENDYRRECDEMIDWLECGDQVICITPVIKFGSEYMYRVATEQYKRLQHITYHKQVIHTRDIGELLVPHKLQIRYIGIEPIEWDIVATDNIKDPMYVYGNKRQQMHYINVLNSSNDKLTRRKLRYIPEYALFSQLYKKLCL